MTRENQRANDNDRYVLTAQPGQIAGAAKRDKPALKAHRPRRPARLRSPRKPLSRSPNRKVRTGQQPSEHDFHAPTTGSRRKRGRGCCSSSLCRRAGCQWRWCCRPVLRGRGWVVGVERCSSLSRPVIGGDLAKSEWLVRRCMSEMSRQAARRQGASAGAKGRFRVSMCQIASVSRRERSIWATLRRRWRPSRRLVCW